MKSIIKAIIEAGDVSGNLVSEALNLRFNYGLAVQCTFTGAPSGSVLVEGSMDEESWSVIDTLAVSGTNILSSNKDAIYWPYVRVSKATGGTGTMTVKVCIKGA
jgi:hypothetical protein